MKKKIMEEFKSFQKRMAGMDEEIRVLVLEYASEIYHDLDCSKEEALEKAIVKAEMERRDL